MKKHTAKALLLLLLFCLMSASAQELLPGTQSYSFSSVTHEMAHESSGTFKPRSEAEPTPFLILDEDGNELKSRYGFTSHDARPAPQIIFPKNPKLEETVALWRKQARESLLEGAKKLKPWQLPKLTEKSLINKINEAFLESNGLLSIIMRDDWETRAAVFDLKDGRQLQLSDLFYEDADYIDYLNQTINDNLYSDGEFGNDSQYYYYYYSLGTQQIAAFTGLANNYPYFALSGSNITFYLPQVNPFFSPHSSLYDQGLSITAVITSEISPYGYSGIALNNRYRSVRLPNTDIVVPLIEMRTGGDPFSPVNAAINQSLYDKLMHAAATFPHEVLALEEVEPWVWRLENLISIHHTADDVWDDASAAVLYGCIYDLKTGKEVNIELIARAYADGVTDWTHWQTLYNGNEESTEPLSLENAAFFDAWLSWGDAFDTLQARFHLPDGTYAHIVLPEEATTALLESLSN